MEAIIIAYLYDKFKGTYRLKVPIDKNTNDYCKKLNGTYEDIDMYIDCQFGNKVFHYGGSILQAYIPSLQRGHNIIKTIQQLDSSIIFNIEEMFFCTSMSLILFCLSNDIGIISKNNPKVFE